MTSPQSSPENLAVRKLAEHDPAAVAETIYDRGEWTLVVQRGHLLKAAGLLSSDAELGFTFLSDLTGVDRFPVEPRFELNYHLVSMSRRERLRLKVRVGSEDPVVPSLTPLWPGADWPEREVFDLFGVRFEGHPDLRRILMPEDWEGHPLRKDYPVEGYR